MEGIKKTVNEIMKLKEISESGFTFIGMGSDRVVFETKGSTRKIVKIDRSLFVKAVLNIVYNEDGEDQRAIEQEINNTQKKLIKREKEQEHEMIAFFGESHFLKRGMFKLKIPITKEFLRLIFGLENEKVEVLPDDFLKELSIVAETQEKETELDNSTTSFFFSTALIKDTNFEDSETFEEAYKKN